MISLAAIALGYCIAVRSTFNVKRRSPTSSRSRGSEPHQNSEPRPKSRSIVHQCPKLPAKPANSPPFSCSRLPLEPNQIQQFLITRQPRLPKNAKIQGADYEKACTNYLADAPKSPLKSARMQGCSESFPKTSSKTGGL